MRQSNEESAGCLMNNLFGEPYEDLPKKKKKIDPERRAWENAFQKWSDKESQDGTSPLGCCGYGQICDYCKDNDKGRPCVRALNAMCRENHITIDYSDRDFERWF